MPVTCRQRKIYIYIYIHSDELGRLLTLFVNNRTKRERERVRRRVPDFVELGKTLTCTY